MIYNQETPGYVIASEWIDGIVKKTFRLTKGGERVHAPQKQAYSSKVTVNTKKLQDVQKIIKYIQHIVKITAFTNNIKKV